MLVIFLFVLLSLHMSTPNHMIIDLQSIYMDQDLHRLCWKEFEVGSIQYSIKLDNAEINKIEDSNKVYCIEGTDVDKKHKFQLTINNSVNVTLNVKFSLPLSSPMPIIRKKVVHGGVYFFLHNNFGGLSSEVKPTCQVLVIYKNNGTFYIKSFTISNNLTKFEKINLGTSFDVYYSCTFTSLFETSSSFVFDKGSIFPLESTQPLQPFIRFPFRRFLVTEWKHSNDIKAYIVAIYESSALQKEICLKIFRLFSTDLKSKESSESFQIIPKNCDKNISIEDLGYYQVYGNGSIYVVLDMVVPLKLNKRYKLSISWQSTDIQNNFIYFEPLPNLNSGDISSAFSDFTLFNYEDFRTKYYSSMLQEDISEHFKDSLTGNITGIDQFRSRFLPVLSTNMPSQIGNTWIESNELINKCKRTLDCNDTLYPFFYSLITKKGTNNFFEIVTFSKVEDWSTKIKEINLTANNNNLTFKVSWNLKSGVIAPAFYAIKIELQTSNSCSMLYIIKCKTCNAKQKKIAERNSYSEISKWQNECADYKIIDNYYEAVDSYISLHTKEMKPETLFLAKIQSLNLQFWTDEKPSKSAYLRATFWRLYGTIAISIICVVIGALILLGIFVWCQQFTSEAKDISQEDSNKYYGEDDV